MKSTPFHNPTEVTKRLIAASAELIRMHDAELGAALDVPLPSVEFGERAPNSLPATAIGENRGLVYRGLRKIYRRLKTVGPLQHPLQDLRDGLRRRR